MASARDALDVMSACTMSVSYSRMTLGMQTYGNYFNALGGQSLRGGLGSIAGNAPDLELLRENRIGEHSLDDGTALVSSGPKDSEKLRHTGQK